MKTKPKEEKSFMDLAGRFFSQTILLLPLLFLIWVYELFAGHAFERLRSGETVYVFSSVVSHLDIAPSLLSFFNRSYSISIPSHACWSGAGLDTTAWFGNRSAYALLQTKEGISDYIRGTSYLSQGVLYQVFPGMELEAVDDEAATEKMSAQLDGIRKFNEKLEGVSAMYPDSLFAKFDQNNQ